MEWWQFAIGFGGLLVPLVLAAFARDRSLFGMLGEAKEDNHRQLDAATAPLHERINRVRDEYVRRDDFAAHEMRIGKTLDDIKDRVENALAEMKADQRRMHEQNSGEMREIKQMIGSLGRVGPGPV